MIQHEGLFLDFIACQGVGSKDLVASSSESYISYLNSVAKLIGSDIAYLLLDWPLYFEDNQRSLEHQLDCASVS